MFMFFWSETEKGGQENHNALVKDIQVSRCYTVYKKIGIYFYLIFCPRKHRAAESLKQREKLYPPPGLMADIGGRGGGMVTLTTMD